MAAPSQTEQGFWAWSGFDTLRGRPLLLATPCVPTVVNAALAVALLLWPGIL